MGAFGLLDDHHHARVPCDLIAEANVRLDIWHLLRCGGLVEGASTTLAFGDTGEGPRPGRTANVCREGPGVTIDRALVRLTWDEAFGVERPWFVCPVCSRRCRHVYLRDDSIACRSCFRLDYASRRLRRQTPGIGRVERLRRKLGDCQVKPFAPLPTRIRRGCGGRSRVFHDRLVSAILDEESKLLGHLQTVTHDLERRIRVRKERGKW